MRIALALVAVAAVLTLPAAASAQAPADERAAAQAFADAAKRFDAAADAAETPGTAWMDPCERALERVPAVHRYGAAMLVMDHSLRRGLAEVRGPLRAFRSELALVPTADPVLISGRAAVRRMGRAVDAVPAPGRFCAELRAWKRAGYPRSTTRAAEKSLDRTIRAVTRGLLRKLDATAMRLRELGVSREDAAAFGGGSGGW
jgi:hypothetical protein